MSLNEAKRLSGRAYEALLAELDAAMDSAPEVDAALEDVVLRAAHGLAPLEEGLWACVAFPRVGKALFQLRFKAIARQASLTPLLQGLTLAEGGQGTA